jgi:DNA-binding NtrC family response regulator
VAGQRARAQERDGVRRGDDGGEPWHLSARIVATTPAPAARAPEADAPGAPDAASASEASRPFRPIADELRELERRRMREALATCGGVQKRAAELISMPIRTFGMKYKQYELGDDDGREE